MATGGVGFTVGLCEDDEYDEPDPVGQLQRLSLLPSG